MPTDASNVLSDLIKLSKEADRITSESFIGNDQISQWFSVVKETAVAIAKGTYCRKSTSGEDRTSFSKDDLPNIVTLVKGKQNSQRLSNLLAEQNRVHLSHRKSRKSLRKIVLGKKSGNQWEISNRKSSVKNDETDDEDKSNFATPKIKDKLLESQFSSSIIASVKKDALSKSLFSKSQSSFAKTSQIDFSTPAHQSKEILAPNTDEVTPAKRPKINFAIGATEIKEKIITRSSVRNMNGSEVKTPIEISQIVKNDPDVSNKSSGSQSDKFLTPENNTIIIDSDSSANKTDFKSPLRRSKRKSSVQHIQENAKKIKCFNTSQTHTMTNAFKQIRSSKDISSVIPGKSFQQQIVQTPSETRILREIQKKEDKVNQNTKKLKSLREMKIEENKKAREKKMEKAMQQRKKIEKEKEERIRSRTHSKIENLQQRESTSKKAAPKKVKAIIKEPEEPSKKLVRSPVKKTSPVEYNLPKIEKNNEVNQTYIHDPSSRVASNTKLLNATYLQSPSNVQNVSTPPPKPIRNAKKPIETSTEKTEPFEKPAEIQPSTATPTSKKTESKINTKTPVSNNAKKPNSYAITPHESSFNSYDISEIKSDDSDEEEREVRKKPIPSWALGYNLKTALLKQHYNQINIDELFGNHFTPPVLAEIMGMEKKHYHKRTSSAIWLNSPNRSRTYT